MEGRVSRARLTGKSGLRRPAPPLFLTGDRSAGPTQPAGPAETRRSSGWWTAIRGLDGPSPGPAVFYQFPWPPHQERIETKETLKLAVLPPRCILTSQRSGRSSRADP